MGPDAVITIVIVVHKHSTLLEERLCLIGGKVSSMACHDSVGAGKVLGGRWVFSVV